LDVVGEGWRMVVEGVMVALAGGSWGVGGLGRRVGGGGGREGGDGGGGGGGGS